MSSHQLVEAFRDAPRAGGIEIGEAEASGLAGAVGELDVTFIVTDYAGAVPLDDIEGTLGQCG